MADIATERANRANKITVFGLMGNAVLSLFKFAAGIFGNSSAMIADAVHSSSDFITDIAVLIGIHFTKKPADSDHSYGHGKYETLASLFVSVFLIIAGLFICISALKSVSFLVAGGVLPAPTYFALVMAAVSVIVKELLYRFTVKEGKKINSMALIANAWHHRSDAFSSVAALLGIAGAMFMGPKWIFLDPLTAVIVSVFIFNAAINIMKMAVGELLDQSLDEEQKKMVKAIFYSTAGVIDVHNLKTRKIGFRISIDAHVSIDKNTSFVRAHAISEEIEIKLCEYFGEETFIFIHTEPV